MPPDIVVHRDSFSISTRKQDLQGLRRISLATRDARGLYGKAGFWRTRNPEYWMEIKDNDIYLKGSR